MLQCFPVPVCGLLHVVRAAFGRVVECGRVKGAYKAEEVADVVAIRYACRSNINLYGALSGELNNEMNRTARKESVSSTPLYYPLPGATRQVGRCPRPVGAVLALRARLRHPKLHT